MSRLLLAFFIPVSFLSALDTGGKAPRLVGSKASVAPPVAGLVNPVSVCVGLDGRTYVSCLGEVGKAGDGSIVVINGGKPESFATGLDDPKGLVPFAGSLFVADRNVIRRIDPKGKVAVHTATKAFPVAPQALNDLLIDPMGNLYVADFGDGKTGGAIFRIDARSRKVTTVVDGKKSPLIKACTGLHFASEYHLHVLDGASGELLRVRIRDGQTEKLASGIAGAAGITQDPFGRLYLTSRTTGKLFAIPRPGVAPVLIAEGFQAPADPCVAADGKSLLVPDQQAGTLSVVPCSVPGHEVAETPLPIRIEPAFAEMEWAEWQGVTDSGKVVEQRPLVLTHAGDGSQRIFMATQHGVIHTFPGDGSARKSKIFLDIKDRVTYLDTQNEEGFLGLAFHPQYKKTGEFFVFYSPKKEKLTTVISRFRVSKEDPDRADPASEEVLLKFKRPFWNHDGGTLAFGPDGLLYIAIGDGGLANDPFGNGQKLSTILGKILRIDIDRKDPGLAYAIPKDNPFVGKEGARGEIWAYGLRNVWRMAFDRKTGQLWAADVGQNLWEEINLIEKGGNYGWNPRESFHPFGDKGVGPNPQMIDPIWEYRHDLGKSITGGHVYRGTRVPALAGLYLYADYVTGHVWALRYDEKQKRVTANHQLRKGGWPIVSFGEDERGEVYILKTSPDGKGIFRFATGGA